MRLREDIPNMDLKQIENCIHAILGPNNEERDTALQILKEYSQDINLSNLLVQIITNDEINIIYRVLSISIFIHLDVIFPPALFTTLLPFFNISDIRFVQQLAYLLSRYIEQDQLIIIINSTTNSNLNYLYGILLLLIDFINLKNSRDNIILSFCANIIAQTQMVPLDSSDIDLVLKIRNIASKAIFYITDPEIDEDPNPEHFPILIALSSLPLNNKMNINVVHNVLQSSRKCLPEIDNYNIFFQHFQALAQMAPLSGKLINIAALIANGIYYIYEYGEEDIKFDEEVLSRCAIFCSILNNEVIARWNMNINEFFVENIYNDDSEEYNNLDDEDSGNESDDFYEKSNFVSLRRVCVDIASKFNSISLQICLEIMRLSPFHMEASFYFLSEILSYNSHFEFDLATPSSDDPILYGQYLCLIASLGIDIDGGLIDECIESNNYFLIFFTAKAINMSYDPVFTDRLIPITLKLLNTLFMYDTPECTDYLKFINELFLKDSRAFIPVLPQVAEILLQILQIVLRNRTATYEITTSFAIFNKIPELTIFVQNSVLSFITHLLINSNGNQYYLQTAIDFMASLFAPLNNSLLPVETISPFFNSFLEIITNSLNSINTPDSVLVPLDDESMITIMTLIAFFARAFSPSPFASPVCQWLSKALMCYQFIETRIFYYLPSCIVHIFQNCSNIDDNILLMNSLFFRLKNDIESQSYIFSLALSFSALVLIDIDYVLKCTEKCGIDIKIVLPQISTIFCNNVYGQYFDYLIILAALFKFGDLIVIDDEEEKPMIVIALESFLLVFDHLFNNDDTRKKGIKTRTLEYIEDKKTDFSKEDPFFLNHPFRHMSFIEFMQCVLPPIEKIPPTFQNDIQMILNYP